jgi:hypothetical protein
MKYFAGLLLLILSVSALADTPTVFYRSGKYLAIRPGTCMVSDLTMPAQVIPQGGSTAGELLLSFLPQFMSLDDYLLTVSAEDSTNIRIACGLDPAPVIIPLWRVAKNGTSTTRPVYELLDPNTNERKSTSIRAGVGDNCENALPTYSLSSSGGKEWRYLAGQTRYVVVCEYK